LGILAAIASVSYVGYIDSAKQTDAKNGLAAIVMKQEQFSINTGAYYISANSCSISTSTDVQTQLFGSQKSLSMTDYCYFTQTAPDGSDASYVASACQLLSTGDCFTLDNLNNKGVVGTKLSW
jgi:Tfp pilus assembly protein PilE